MGNVNLPRKANMTIFLSQIRIFFCQNGVFLRKKVDPSI